MPLPANKTSKNINDVGPQSKHLAGILLLVLPTVMYGGVSRLYLLYNDPSYSDNLLRHDLFRAGHAHAAVLLVLSLVVLKYVDEASLSLPWKRVVRYSVPVSAILIPGAFFLSVLDPGATHPNALINLAYAGAVLLAAGIITLGIGLVKNENR